MSWEGCRSPATPERLLSPLTLQSAELTPGRVFCSCRALWAFRAESRAQYVRKAHPEETQVERQGWGESPVSPC